MELNKPENRLEYVAARNLAKEVVKAAKMLFWEAFVRDIEENYRANQKRFWSTVNGLRKARVSRA